MKVKSLAQKQATMNSARAQNRSTRVPRTNHKAITPPDSETLRQLKNLIETVSELHNCFSTDPLTDLSSHKKFPISETTLKG